MKKSNPDSPDSYRDRDKIENDQLFTNHVVIFDFCLFTYEFKAKLICNSQND